MSLTTTPGVSSPCVCGGDWLDSTSPSHVRTPYVSPLHVHTPRVHSHCKYALCAPVPIANTYSAWPARCGAAEAGPLAGTAAAAVSPLSSGVPLAAAPPVPGSCRVGSRAGLWADRQSARAQPSRQSSPTAQSTAWGETVPHKHPPHIGSAKMATRRAPGGLRQEAEGDLNEPTGVCVHRCFKQRVNAGAEGNEALLEWRTGDTPILQVRRHPSKKCRHFLRLGSGGWGWRVGR